MNIKVCFVIALFLFFIFFPLYGSRKSFWDIISARKTIRIIRFCILFEYILIAIVLYYYINHGPPVTDNILLSYGSSVAGLKALSGGWLYGFAKPLFSLVFIGIGILGDLHPATRYLCMIGCAAEVFGSSLASFQVLDLINQILYHGAVSSSYTVSNLRVYYWANIISIGFCVYIFMMTTLLSCIVG